MLRISQWLRHRLHRQEDSTQARSDGRALLHESGHNCGIPGGAGIGYGPDSHLLHGRGRNSISLTGGGYLGGEEDAMLSYRRLLGDFASDRLRFTLVPI